MSESVQSVSSKEFINRCEVSLRELILNHFREGEEIAYREIHDLCQKATMESVMSDHRAKYDEIIATKDYISKMCSQVLSSLPFGKDLGNDTGHRAKLVKIGNRKISYYIRGENLIVETKYARNVVPLNILEKLWEAISHMPKYKKIEICKLVKENKGQSFAMNGVTIPGTMPHIANYGLGFFSASGLAKLSGKGRIKGFTVVGDMEAFKSIISQLRQP